MKYELYKKESKSDKVVMLQLVKTPDWNVKLIAVDNTGMPLLSSTLLLLNQEGRIARCRHISNELGFDLDSDGRIKLTSE